MRRRGLYAGALHRGTEQPAQVCFDCFVSNLLLLFPVLKPRSGPAAGSLVPLASIVVTDQSGVEMKVVLWRRAAFWVLTVRPGDVLLIKGTMWHWTYQNNGQSGVASLYRSRGASRC